MSGTKTFVAVFVILILISFLFFALSFQKKSTVFSNGGQKIKAPERINFLVLGKTGKVVGWNMSPDLADTIILVDYLPKIAAINLISLPRDLYVTVGGESFKLNEVLRRKKLEGFMAEVLPQITGLETDKYLVVDLDFVKNVVNEMGGVDIALDEPATDWVSGYTLKAGNHHLNGDDAVWLARNRFARGGDFYREKNQQKIINSISVKFKELSLWDKLALSYKLAPELSRLENNLDLRELMSLTEKIKGIRFNNVVLDFETGLLQSSQVFLAMPVSDVFPLASTPAASSSDPAAASSTVAVTSTSTAAYILIPKSGANNYGAIREFIQKKLEN